MKRQMKAILFAGVLMLAGLIMGSEAASAETVQIKYSGKDGGVNWSIDTRGHLLLQGRSALCRFRSWYRRRWTVSPIPRQTALNTFWRQTVLRANLYVQLQRKERPAVNEHRSNHSLDRTVVWHSDFSPRVRSFLYGKIIWHPGQ